jgi:HAD superfamily hydrolase (TIGR01549 family)
MSVVEPWRHPIPNWDKTTQAAVLFDFGGTLDANGVAWKERFFQLYRDEGVKIAPERFEPIFYAADDALVGAVPASLPLRDIVVRLAQSLTQALDLRDLTLVERIAKRFLEETLQQLSINTAVLGRLSRRYRLGVVSNFYGNLAAVCHEAGLSPFLTVVVDSACIGYVKPDPRIFFAALAELRTDPAQTLFVGDSLRRDMAGARAVGMPHVWLTPATPQGEGPCCPNDRAVQTLDELLRGLL